MCRPTDFLPRAAPTGGQPRGLASLIGKIDYANASLSHVSAVISKGPSTTTMKSSTVSSAGPVTRRRSLKRTEGTITPDNHDASRTGGVSQGSSHVTTKSEGNHENLPSSSTNAPSTTSKRGRRRRQCSSSSSGGGGSRGHHHDRTFVQHSYHDHALDGPETVAAAAAAVDAPAAQLKEQKRGNTSLPFPMVLHNILDDAESEGYSDAISWQPHGRAFLVHDQDKFVSQVMPRFFRQTRFSSFQRQLSLYGFLRLTRKGADSGAYYNEYFLRGKPFLCRKMSRTRIKGYWVRQSSSPETEPDFYQLPPVGGEESSSFSSLRCNPTDNNNMETEERVGAEAQDIDYDPLPLTAAFPAPWTVPMDCQIVTAALESTETRRRQQQQQHRHHHHYSRPLPPMPPLSSYRPDILDFSCSANKVREDPKDLLNLLSVAKIPPPVIAPIAPGETGISPEDQEALAEFLSDVDLESEDTDDDAYHGEQQMENIYVHAARI